ncbi:MAG: endopeptidase La [Oligoflexales bacterium]
MKKSADHSQINEKHSKTQTIDILPFENTVLFPGNTIPLTSLSDLTPKQLKDIQSHGTITGVVLHDGDGWASTGTFASLTGVLKTPEGGLGGLFRGETRFQVKKIRETRDGRWVAEVQEIEDRPARRTQKTLGMTKALKHLMIQLLTQSPQWGEESLALAGVVDDPHSISYLITPMLSLTPREKQEILENPDPLAKMKLLTLLATKELELMKAANQVEEEAKSSLNQNIRRSWLNEKLQAIRKELDEVDGVEDEIEQLENSFRGLPLSPKVQEQILREIKRLEMMPQGSSEATVSLTYLQALHDLPWAEDEVQPAHPKQIMTHAQQLLDNEHHGLEKVKNRVLEHLAVMLHQQKVPGKTLLLVGPPGVGKTSLATSIAHALQRPFARVSLGGVKDEAEIRGHRRTYVGAMPGKIMQAIKQAESRSSVILLDEIDKVGRDHGHDLSSALLEVLDPEQNKSFQDHYINVPFDLSQTFFVATANSLENIPAPLRDRMEVIELSGYTDVEKSNIAQKHLIPKISTELGLDRRRFRFSDDTLEYIIRHYTREAGVRQLSKTLSTLGQRMVRRIVEGKKQTKFDTTHISQELGPMRFLEEPTYGSLPVGVAQGLAYTAMGGDLLYLETNLNPLSEGRGRLLLTGHLGKVMQESVQTALSYLHGRSGELGIELKMFEKNDIHVHFPDGATPKDGPSAGIAALSALYSLFTKQPIPANFAMTGEITLRGQVLPVGGIREKFIAAHRYGKKHIIMPAQNWNDLEELPKDIRKDLRFYPVHDMMEVLKVIGLIKGTSLGPQTYKAFTKKSHLPQGELH